MLGKCANPSCNVPFRYLRGGRLFLVDVPPMNPAERVNGFDRHKPHRTKYFWLCSDCASTMAVAVNQEGVAVVQRRERLIGAIE